MSITLIRKTEDHTTWVETAADGPITAELTQDETQVTIEALVTAHLFARNTPDPKRQRLIERTLVRLGVDLESLDALHVY